MIVKYVDAHCHLQFKQYDADRDALIEQMREKGVVGVIVGCDYESSLKAITLALTNEHLYASVGQHPNQGEDFDEVRFRALLASPRVVAVGECGLDYFRLETGDDNAYFAEATKAKQKAIFKKQIALATEFDKPLIIHTRPSFAKATEGKPSYDAYRDTIEILREAKSQHPKLRGDMHFFVGGVKEAEAFIALGFTLSFTAVITFAHDYDGVIKTIPLTSILSETDSPYVAPASRRGERNDPLSVEEVVARIAEIRGEDVEIVQQALRTNSERIFSL